MDPFNSVVEMFVSDVLFRPSISFSMKLDDLKQWRKEDQAVFMRMVKVDSITITIDDPYIAGYAMALVRTQTLNAQQIAESIVEIDEETAKNRVMTLLQDTWLTPVDNEDEEEITCVISNVLKLRCPLSFERCV